MLPNTTSWCADNSAALNEVIRAKGYLGCSKLVRASGVDMLVGLVIGRGLVLVAAGGDGDPSALAVALIPACRMRRATRWRLTHPPCSMSSAPTRGMP